MGLARWDIIQALVGVTGATRYLEVGVQGGECFQRVLCPVRVGVDPDATSRATVHLPSDEYFARLGADERFGVVFVDGLHHREQVCRDVLNAYRHLEPGGAIVVHDCDPPTEQSGRREICGGIWCGDVWQGWLDARQQLASLGESAPWTGTVATDLGCGLVLPWLPPQPVPTLPAAERTWARFQATRDEWLGLVSPEAFLEMVRVERAR